MTVQPALTTRLTLLCAIPSEAWQRLQSAENWSTQAATALHDGAALLPNVATLAGHHDWCKDGLRYRGVLVPPTAREDAALLARMAFGGRRDWAAGWLIGWGLGLPYNLPSDTALHHAPVVAPTPVAVSRGPRDTADHWRVKPRRVAPPVREGEVVQDGAALQARREALGLSQRDFAPLVGVSRGTISGVESGYRPHPATRQLVGDVLTRLERERLEESRRAPSGAELQAARLGLGLSKVTAGRYAGLGVWHVTEAEVREQAAGAVLGARYKLHLLYTRLRLERAAREAAQP